VKNLSDEAAAAKHAARLIEEKTGKGYREVT
jgi:predicted DNA-binding WGR domain protein